MMSMLTLIICVRKYVSYSTTEVACPLFPMLCSGKNSLWVTYPGSMELVILHILEDRALTNIF